jgi:Reverse transcriptase (RNA-dependent DNA polymerase)
MKVDFSKAFDSVNWEFLLNVLSSRGFPLKWLQWMRELLSSSSSRVILNGEQSPFFEHKKGLRQGDPLSPQLFVIAVDVLQQILRAANLTLTSAISEKFQQPTLTMQYADDTTLIASADQETLVMISLVLDIFTKVSGLEINYEKSVFVPFNLDMQQIDRTKLILRCNKQELPITYLGAHNQQTIQRPLSASH